MQQIDALLARLEHAEHIDSLRRDIFTLIRERLDAHRDTLDHRAKLHFSNAIATLSLNVHSLMNQPSSYWLRLCLHDLRQAICPESIRDTGIDLQMHHPLDQAMNYAGLSAALDEIGAKIGLFPGAKHMQDSLESAIRQHEMPMETSRNRSPNAS